MAGVSTDRTVQASTGRGYLWAGIAFAVLGVVLAILQFAVMRWTVVPWQAPVLATLGVCLVLAALLRRRTVSRFIVLAVLLALTGFEWFVLTSVAKLAPYEGPARAGQGLPPFQTVLADGKPFSNANLQDGTPSVLVFFRGRW